MTHEIIDLFAFVVALLGLIPLWREQGRKFLAALFACLLLAGACYVVWDHYQAVQVQRAEAMDLANKEDQVISLLCHGGANYEEIYSRTSFGFSNQVLDDAIDDLMQNRHMVKIEYLNLKQTGQPPRDMTVRIFEVTSNDVCPSPGK